MAFLDFDAVDIDLEDIALEIDLDSSEAGVLTSYQQKKYLHSQLSNLIIISLAYCSSVAFRNAIFETFSLIYDSDNSRGWELTLTMFGFSLLATVLGIITTFLISKKESEKEANSYVEAENQKFEIEIERAKREVFIPEEEEMQQSEQRQQPQNKVDIMFAEIIDISMKLDAIADATFDSLLGKFSGFIEHCFAFASAYSWKESIYTLFLTIYKDDWLIVLSLWIYAFVISIVAVLLTILVFRKMGVTHRTLLSRLRGLEDKNNEKLNKVATTYIYDDKTSPSQEVELDNESDVTFKSVIDIFNKDVFIVKTFEFLEITLSVLSAWAFRDAITTTIAIFTDENSQQLAGLWIYCGIMLASGGMVTYFFARKMSTLRDEIAELQNEQCKCKKKHNTLQRYATIVELHKTRTTRLTNMSEEDRNAKITRLGTSLQNMSKQDNENSQSLVESESKEYKLRLIERLIQLLLNSIAFNCGLALYDATFLSFTLTTRNQSTANKLIRGFLLLLIFSIVVTLLAVFIILYLDRMLKTVSQIFQMPWNFIQKRGFDVPIREIIKQKSEEDENENKKEAGQTDTTNKIEKQLTADQDGNNIKASNEDAVKEKVNVISTITIFAKFFVNVVSLCVALAYCAAFQKLFDTIYSAEGSVISLWVFCVVVIIISVIVTILVGKCIKAENIKKTHPTKTDLELEKAENRKNPPGLETIKSGAEYD